jgi:GntR family transcriptional regulator
LGLSADRELLYMRRLRLADEQAVILERRWCPGELCPGLSRRDLAGSVYALWTQRYRLEIAGADQLLRAVNLTRAQAQLLGLPQGRAALLSVSTGYLTDGRPLWHEKTLYRADAYEFHNHLGGLRRSGPAVGKFCPLPPPTQS